MFYIIGGTHLNDEVLKLMKALTASGLDCFVNYNNELIASRKENVFFRLEGVTTRHDLERKVISWLTRSCVTGLKPRVMKQFRDGVNRYLGTEFSEEDFSLIYTKFGMKYEYDEIDAFIASGYDLTYIKLEDGRYLV